DRVADIHNVGGLQAGNGEGEGALAVVVGQFARCVGGATVNGGHVNEADLFGGAGTADAQGLNGGNGIKTGFAADANAAPVDFHRAAGLHAVFRLQGVEHGFQWNAETDQTLLGNFHVNYFHRLASRGDFRDVRYGQQFAAQET